MILNAQQRREIAAKRGLWIREACDRCHNLIVLPWTFTRKDQPEVYCSRLCRDGKDKAAKHAGRPKKRENSMAKQREYRRRLRALRNRVLSPNEST